MGKINKLILISIIIIASTNVLSQVNNIDTIHLLRFKAIEKNTTFGIPFIDFCLLENDSVKDCCTTDFDGHSLLIIHSKEYNLNSAFLKIRKQGLEASKNNNNFIKLLIKDIEIDKGIVFDNIYIFLNSHEIMTPKEYKKYLKLHKRMPGRK